MSNYLHEILRLNVVTLNGMIDRIEEKFNLQNVQFVKVRSTIFGNAEPTS
jgi:hypothetical protein